MTAVPLVAAAFETPFDELNVLVTPEDGVVRAAAFKPLPDVVAQLPTAFGMRGWESGELPEVARAIVAWSEGDADGLTAIPVEQPGGPFFQEVWQSLRSVPSGEVVSYQELAEMAGRPRAMRAVGTACARNTIALFVPCHRVIQSGGRLGSYGFGGAHVKRALLEHEGLRVDSNRADARVGLAT